MIDALDGVALPATRAHLGAGVDVLNERAAGHPGRRRSTSSPRVVTARTRDLGEPPRKRFVGHLTLARLKRHARMPAAIGALVTGEFDVEEVALVQSRLDPQGARYETLSPGPSADPSAYAG